MNLGKNILFQAKYLSRAFILTIIIVFAYLFIKDNREQSKKRLFEVLKQPFLLLFLLYFSYLLVGTLFSRWPQNPYGYILENFGIVNNKGLNSQFVENTLLFIPYSFLFLQAFKPQKPFRVGLILTFLTTCFIEFSQLLFWLGEFQFSDIVHNSLGGVLGCVLWYMVNCMKTKHVIGRMWSFIRKKFGMIGEKKHSEESSK